MVELVGGAGWIGWLCDGWLCWLGVRVGCVVVLVGGVCLGWLGAGWLGWLAVVVGCDGWGAGWLGWMDVLVGWAGCVLVGGAGWCVAGWFWLRGGVGVMVGRAGWW